MSIKNNWKKTVSESVGRAYYVLCAKLLMNAPLRQLQMIMYSLLSFEKNESSF